MALPLTFNNAKTFSVSSAPVYLNTYMKSDLNYIDRTYLFTDEYLQSINLSLPEQVQVSLVPIQVPILPTQFILIQYNIENVNETDYAQLDSFFFNSEMAKFGSNNTLSANHPALTLKPSGSVSPLLLLMLIKDVPNNMCYRVVTNNMLADPNSI